MDRDGNGSTHGRPVILYCYPRRSTFIERDVSGLAASFEVRTNELRADPAYLLPLRLFQQFIWLIRNRSWTRDCICHFSGYHAVLPTLLCRRTFIILAGSDCASIPSIGYGAHARRLLGRATGLAASGATRLLPVHERLMRRHQTYSDAVPSEQGLAAFARVDHVPWTVVPYGFDASFWCPDSTVDRDPGLFVCVPGPVAPENRLHALKGIDLVLKIAERIPQARFLVVGLADTAAYKSASPNVEFIGRLPPEQLRDLYRSSSFHLQLSLSEGMPNALCEAMLCGCIPLVSAVSSMPDIVRGAGRVLERKDVDQAVRICTELLAMTAEQRAIRSHGSRERIRAEFPMNRRISTLTCLLNEGTPGGRSSWPARSTQDRPPSRTPPPSTGR